jgi:hypothetical protein
VASGVSVLVIVLALLGMGSGASEAAGAVTVSASIGGQPLGTSSQNKPVVLRPGQDSLLIITVTNGGSTAVEVTKVRLQGQVIGLTFFEYDTSVSMSVPPGATETRRLMLDLSGLAGQATGLIPGTVKVLDARRHVLAQENGVTDVRGSLRSVYGLFGLGVAFLTALSFAGALVGLARHRLPVNRWRRGLRFLTPGLGLGLMLNFTLSATRVFVPEIGRWLTITAVCAAVLFTLGYLTPTPDLEEDEPEADQGPRTLVEEVTLVAIAARPGRPALPAPPAQPLAPAPPVLPAPPAVPAPAAPPPPAVPAPAAPAPPAGLAAPAPVSGPEPAVAPAPVAAVPAAAGVKPIPAAVSSAGSGASADPRATLPVGFTAVAAPADQPGNRSAESVPPAPSDDTAPPGDS